MNQRYVILDGLRGVAAIGVLVYHLFEAIAFSAGAAEQHFYHGFLAVDFFFILSGFVMGYAYDARLADGRLTMGGFIRRRLIRLTEKGEGLVEELRGQFILAESAILQGFDQAEQCQLKSFLQRIIKNLEVRAVC